MRAAGSTALAHRGSANEYWLTFTWLQVQKDWNRSQNKKPFPNNSASLDFLPPTLAGFCRRARGLRVRVARARGEREWKIFPAPATTRRQHFFRERDARGSNPPQRRLRRRCRAAANNNSVSVPTRSREQARDAPRRRPASPTIAHPPTSACVRSLTPPHPSCADR